MAIGDIDVGQELLNVPMGDMISSMALAIAESQWQLDKASMTVAELMSGQRMLRDLDTGQLVNTTSDNEPTIVDSRVYFGYTYEKLDSSDGDVPQYKRVPQKLSMLELGFVPNFYQFVDTIIEVKIAVSLKGSTDTTKREFERDSASTATSEYSASATRTWWRPQSVSVGRSQTYNVSTSQVDARYANKYSYSVDGASLLRTKLVPIPPPPILEERIRQVMDEEKRYEKGVSGTFRLKAGIDPEE